MDGRLVELSTEKLLKKFGAGSHKPGSGSAAALQGMLSAQLTRTVIDLTGGKNSYKEWHAKLKKVDSEIESHIYPSLEELFQEDSIQFDKAIQQRKARDRETNILRKSQLKSQALEELKPATEIPIKIAQLCIKLADFAVLTFDHGFRSARGDSSVALNSAISAIAGCLAIIDLNLESFSTSKWTEKIRSETEQIRVNYRQLSLKAIEKLDYLKKEADQKNLYSLEKNSFLSSLSDESEMSYADIEEIAKKLQNIIWVVYLK
ncbi:MAG: cyclodeaminase/cyclohydrolase family protein [Bacteroidota bacterium]